MKYNEKTLKGIYQRIVASMSGVSGINVELSPNYTPAYSPAKNLILMPICISHATSEDEDFMLGRGSCVHEASHVMFAPKLDPIQMSDLGKDTKELLNVFVDVNNEHKVAQLWPHLGTVLKDKTAAVLKREDGKFLSHPNPFLQTLLRCDTLIQEEFTIKFPENYHPIIKRFVTGTVRSFNKENIKEVGAKEIVKFTRKIGKRWEKVKEKLGMESEDLRKQLEQLVRQLGEAKMKGDKNGERLTAEEIKKRRGQLGKYQIDRSGMEKLSPMHRETGKHHASEKKEGMPDYSNMSLEELKRMLEQKSQEDGGSECGWGTLNKTIKDLERDGVKKVYKQDSDHDKKGDREFAYKQGKRINRELRKKVLLMDSFEKRQRSGRVDFGEVRRQVGQFGQLTSNTLFQRDNNFQRGGSWYVDILIDCSGSMRRENQGVQKIDHAVTALMTTAYAFEGLPNMRYGISGFNSSHEDVKDIRVKEFNQKVRMPIIQQLYAGDGNADGINILESVKRLMKFPNKKRLIVIISDGQPAYARGIDHTKKVVELAERVGINVIGIGIPGCTETTLEEIYPNRFMFEAIDDIHKELVNVILKTVNQNRNSPKLVKRRWE